MTYTPDFIIDKKQFLDSLNNLSIDEEENFMEDIGVQKIDDLNTLILREYEYIVICTEFSYQVSILKEYLEKNNIIYATTY